jgi:hypothetical protein
MASAQSTIDPLLVKLLVSGILCGVFLHQLVKRVELDRHPLSIFVSVVIAYFVLAAGLQSNQYENSLKAYGVALLVESFAILSLWTNMLVYRAFLHPLKDFPGPFGARLSKFWSLGKVIQSNIRWYQVVGKLQEQYGDYVRTGMTSHCK